MAEHKDQLEGSVTMVGTEMQTWQATVPSGPNQTMEPAGLFTGDEESIRQFVSLKSGVWRVSQVQLKRCVVVHMHPRKLAVWQKIKGNADTALKQLEEMEKASPETEYLS